MKKFWRVFAKMSQKQVNRYKKWRIMEFQNIVEPDENSGRPFPEQLNQQELNKLPGIDQSNNGNLLYDANKFVDDKDNRQIASTEEVRSEIEKAFKQDKYLMTKLIKEVETITFGYKLTGKFVEINAADIVMTAIEKILLGISKWDKNKCPNIVVLIYGVIKSEIRNKVNSKENGNNQKIVPLENENYENNDNNNIYDIESGRRYNPLNPETDVDEEVLYQRILTLFEDDPIAYCVLEELLSSSDYDIKEQNQLLAKNLGIEVTDVEKAKKRIKYRLQFLKKK